MASSVAAELLAEIDPLAYPERMRLLAGRARALSGSPDLASVLGDLYRGDRFQREIARVHGHRGRSSADDRGRGRRPGLGHPPVGAGLFAVALAQYGARLGWPAAWREQIRVLRTHSRAEVRTAALETAMARE